MNAPMQSSTFVVARSFGRPVRALAVWLCVLLLAGGTPRAWGAEGDRAMRVLMVHSFGGSVPPFATHSTAFGSAIKRELGADVDLDQVSLENARYSDPDVEEAFAEFLAKRLAKWQPDLVVPAGAPAVLFVAKYRDKLFPNTPVIYSWVDKRMLPAGALAYNATFVGQTLDLKNLVEDMLQLDPETNNVVVIFGATPLERFWAGAFRAAFEPFESRMKFTFVNDLSFEQMQDLVSKLPPHSFVQLGLLLRDAAGVTFNQDEVLQRLSAASRAPVNGMFRYQVGRGIVGGRLMQDETTGVQTARVAARILRGESASSFPPEEIPMGKPTYDWRELRRWGISESLLPPGSVVLFRQPTAWELYGWYVAGAVVVIATQAGLISALLVQCRRRNIAELAQRKAMAEIQQKRAQLEHVARIATLGELTATLTHELRQPLAAISMSSSLGMELVAAPQLDLKEIRETFSGISDITQRAGEMIQGMRVMLKRDTPGLTTIDLNDLIRSIDRVVYGDAMLHGVTVDMDLSPAALLVNGDGVQLQQVIMNLMLNAFGAMSDMERDGRRLIVRTKPADGNVLLEVEDRGTGIPAEKLESVFEPFFTSKRDGLGIGLSICRSIIERHGGRIWAENNADRGATFSIMLPASRGLT